MRRGKGGRERILRLLPAPFTVLATFGRALLLFGALDFLLKDDKSRLGLQSPLKVVLMMIFIDPLSSQRVIKEFFL